MSDQGDDYNYNYRNNYRNDEHYQDNYQRPVQFYQREGGRGGNRPRGGGRRGSYVYTRKQRRGNDYEGARGVGRGRNNYRDDGRNNYRGDGQNNYREDQRNNYREMQQADDNYQYRNDNMRKGYRRNNYREEEHRETNPVRQRNGYHDPQYAEESCMPGRGEYLTGNQPRPRPPRRPRRGRTRATSTRSTASTESNREDPTWVKQLDETWTLRKLIKFNTLNMNS